MLERIKQKRYFIIMCLICILPRIFLSIYALPFRTRADELGTLAGAALMAGFDWSDLISETAYYGFGASIILTPLFYIFSDPIIIYKVMIGIWGIIQSFVGLIAWHLSKKFFSINNDKILMLLSVIASYSVVTRNTALFNETPLILVTWLLVWCLLALNESGNTKKKYFVSVIFMLLLSYSLTLHTRALIFWIAALVIGLFYFCVKRRTLFSTRIFLLLGSLGYIGTKSLIKYMQKIIWTGEAGAGLANTRIGTSGLAIIAFPESWQAWMNIVIGQLNTFALVSGTIIILGLVWIVREGIYIVKNKFVVSDDKIPYLCILGFATCCMLGTVLGQSISEWLGYAVEAMKNGMDNQAYGLKVFTYIRYAGPYLGVIVWGIIIYAIKNRREILKLRGIVIVTCIIVNIYWIICIVPYIYHNEVTNEAYLPFAFINNITGTTRLRTYLIGTVIIILFLAIFWIFYSVRKLPVFLCILSFLLMYQYIYDGYNQDILQMEQSYAEIEDTYLALKKLDDKGLIPQEIYVFDVKNQSHPVSYVYQFCMYDKNVNIIKDINEKISENTIIITNGQNEFQTYIIKGYTGYIINQEKEEYLLTDNENIILELNKAGYISFQ